MATKKGGLGKGLDSLIVNKNEGVVAVNPEQHGSPVEVDIDKVEPNKLQPRKNFDEDKLQELADNIKIHGIVNPIIVQDRQKYCHRSVLRMNRFSSLAWTFAHQHLPSSQERRSASPVSA